MDRAVLRYFLRNPQAADSVEGIARWRLLEEIAASTVEETQAALRRLVARGLLTEESTQGVQTLYRLDTKKSVSEEPSAFVRRRWRKSP